MLAIHWYDEAIDNLVDIVAYIAERDPQAAQRLRDRIETALGLVAEQPYMHKVGRVPGSREIVAHPNYVVVYLVTDRIEVAAILHARQEYP
jgi:plasmid stabilization system protein ParE